MLTFRRKINEKIYINDNISIEILGMADSRTVVVGINAPDDMLILRGEHIETPEQENRKAAEADFCMSELIALMETRNAL